MKMDSSFQTKPFECSYTDFNTKGGSLEEEKRKKKMMFQVNCEYKSPVSSQVAIC